MKKTALVIAVLGGCHVVAIAQDQAATPPSVVNINISVSRTVQAVSYPNNTSSSIDFTGTPFLPLARARQK